MGGLGGGLTVRPMKESPGRYEIVRDDGLVLLAGVRKSDVDDWVERLAVTWGEQHE
jgi:hypothetical protein